MYDELRNICVENLVTARIMQRPRWHKQTESKFELEFDKYGTLHRFDNMHDGLVAVCIGNLAAMAVFVIRTSDGPHLGQPKLSDKSRRALIKHFGLVKTSYGWQRPK